MMETLAVSLTNGEWSLISAGSTTVAIDVKTASRILIHFGGAIAPALDAPAVSVSSWHDGPDAVFEGLGSADSVWCRSIDPSALIVVVRK
jgi:hypothetical protein